jgi:cell wall-associated NlpC family hydrolase
MLHLALAAGVAGVSVMPARADEGASAEAAREATHAGAELVIRSLSLLGVRYRFGGNSPDTGLDCSGLVRHVYQGAIGLVLPRRAEEISRKGERVTLDQLRAGDLVFFNTLRRAFSHVGVYIGDNRFVHAPSAGGRVRVESIDTRYWLKRFSGARRLDVAENTRFADARFADARSPDAPEPRDALRSLPHSPN